MKIELKNVPMPELSENVVPVDLSDSTLKERKEKLLEQMKRNDLDTTIIYADREHGANFEYLTGFIPRFEEALLVLHKDGEAFLLLGNENTKMVNYSRIEAQLIHVPFFSLPNQPMEHDAELTTFFTQAKIKTTNKIGIVGWKYFTSGVEKNNYLFDVPYFIIDTLKNMLTNEEQLTNEAGLFISPESGIRTTNNANEIAHYEYGATLAGIGILNTINLAYVGKTELELANHLTLCGQPTNVTTICATGERFTNATIYPRNKQLELGDKFSTTVGYKGGLSSRGAYVANKRQDLLESEQAYEEKIAKPYYQALVTWLESMHVGCEAAQIFETIEAVLPKKKYHWELNPGHYVADEEWVSSPFYANSTAKIKSGQLFQIDIIPKVAGVGGVGCEDGIAVADETLRNELAQEYPAVWSRICRRKNYLKNELNITLPEDILPLNDVVAYYRPYILNHEHAFCVEK